MRKAAHSTYESMGEAPPSAQHAAARVLREASVRPQAAPVITRSLNALASAVAALDDRSLNEAASASTDHEALVTWLVTPEVVPELLREPEPLVGARIRGLINRGRLLAAEGGAASASTVGQLLGISRQAVDKRRKAGTLLAVSVGRRGYLYPLWQFDEGGTLPGLETVLAELTGHDPWMKVVFMLNANTRLDGETPLSKLRRGRVDQVVHAARAFGEHGSA